MLLDAQSSASQSIRNKRLGMEEIHSNPMTFKTLKIACTLSVHGSFLNLIFSLPWLVVGFNTWFIAEPMS